MTAMANQIAALTQEIDIIKNEVIGLKAAHAGLHQSSVDAGASTRQQFTEIANRIEGVESKLPAISGGSSKKPLIEPKQLVVEEFIGSVGDAMDKFLEWTERAKDRIQLFDPQVLEAMKKIERTKEVITREQSESLGVNPQSNRELQSYLKDRTGGTAGAIVRGNAGGIGLESWRLLWNEYSPKTLTTTMLCQQRKKNPQGRQNLG